MTNRKWLALNIGAGLLVGAFVVLLILSGVAGTSEGAPCIDRPCEPIVAHP